MLWPIGLSTRCQCLSPEAVPIWYLTDTVYFLPTFYLVVSAYLYCAMLEVKAVFFYSLINKSNTYRRTWHTNIPFFKICFYLSLLSGAGEHMKIWKLLSIKFRKLPGALSRSLNGCRSPDLGAESYTPAFCNSIIYSYVLSVLSSSSRHIFLLK